jgi:hypothetical protein
MEILNESQASALRGGWWSITVAPTIVVTNAFQTNAGATVAVGLLGGSALSGLSQGNILSLLSSSR